jgi:hypothetical protein
MSSLVLVPSVSQKPGAKELTSGERRDYAAKAGVKLIKLIYRGHCSPKTTGDIEHRGFRTVRVMIDTRPNAKRRVYPLWKTDRDGRPSSEHHLIFSGNEYGEGEAWLPDDPDQFNRRKLAFAKIGKNEPWKIDDHEINKQIEQLAKEIEDSPEFKEAKLNIEATRVASRMKKEAEKQGGDTPAISESEAKIKVLQNRIKELEATRRADEVEQEYKEKLKEPSKIDENAATVDEEKRSRPGKEKKLSHDEKRAIRKIVYAELPEIVAKLKAKYGDEKWTKSPEYWKEIHPTVAKRYEEKINEHSIAGDAD